MNYAKRNKMELEFIKCKKGKRECRKATEVCMSCKKNLKCDSYQKYLMRKLIDKTITNSELMVLNTDNNYVRTK